MESELQTILLGAILAGKTEILDKVKDGDFATRLQPLVKAIRAAVDGKGEALESFIKAKNCEVSTPKKPGWALDALLDRFVEEANHRRVMTELQRLRLTGHSLTSGDLAEQCQAITGRANDE